MKNFIYELVDPETNKPRYIGKTNDPIKRFKKHLSDNKFGYWTPKNKWISSLIEKGLKPIINILEETEENNINTLEIEYIKKYRELYNDLTNDTDGGDGYDWTGRKHTDDTIERLKLCNPNRKSIFQFDMSNNFIKLYASGREIDKNGFNRRSVVRSCKNEIKQFKGYYFRFSDNFFPCELAQPIKNMEDIQKILDSNKLEKLPNKRKQKTIDKNALVKATKLANKKPQKIYVHYDLLGNILGTYNGIIEASRKSGCHPHLIYICCNKKEYYTANDTTFRYKGDVFDYYTYNKNIQVTSRKISKYTLDGTFIETYDSIKRAAANNGVIAANVSMCCIKKNKKNGKSIVIGGFTYRYYEDNFYIKY